MEENSMKKYIAAIIAFLLLISAAGCAKTDVSLTSAQTDNGIESLIDKARQELPVSDADSTDMQYAGMSIIDDKALAWFISGSEYQAHYYMPMEVEINSNGEYSFVRTYKPLDGEVKDVAALQWNSGWSFVINNIDCAAVRITDENGIHDEKIEDGSYPYVFWYQGSPSEYTFINSKGDEL